MNHRKNGALALAALSCACIAGQANALEVLDAKGWKLNIGGSVNAFYTSTKADNAARRTSIENGLLPGYFNISASTNYKGLDVKGVIGIWPGIDSDSPALGASGTAGIGKSTVDARTNYLSFGNASMGSFKFGRDLGLFQSNAILNDMTLIGVGGGAAGARNINTTLGGIGAGYIYAEFQPQITYTSPKIGGGLTLSAGVFDNKDVNAAGTPGRNPGYQGLAEYAFSSGKLWAGFVNQNFDLTRTDNATGWELGGKADVGNLGLLAQGFSGKGIGDTVLYAGGVDAAGNGRKSNGFLGQLTYKIGDLKLGVNTGESRTKATGAEGGGDINKVRGLTLGAYYSLTPNVTLVGELNNRKNKLTGVDTDTIALGAIMFF